MADRTTIVVASGDMDKLYSALIIANGSLAMAWTFRCISPSGAWNG